MTTKNEKPLREIALDALKEVAEDKNAPAAARAQASRTILEMLGELGRGADARGDVAERDLSTLSAAEIDAEIARMQKSGAGRKQ